jgi:hypothetical protein
MQIIKSKKIATAIFAMILVIASTRGIPELVFNKPTAFSIQFFLIIFLFSLIVNWSFIIRFATKTIQGKLSLIVLLISFLSLIVTLIKYGYAGYNYLAVMLFTCFVLFSTYSLINFKTINLRLSFNLVISIGLILSFFALVQQLRIPFIEFPGATVDFGLIRPQSITGSFLHYPIILAIISSCYFVNLIQKPTLLKGILFLYFFLVLVFTLSRSGMLILFAVIGFKIGQKLNFKTIIILFSLTFIFFLISTILPDSVNIITNRIFGATNINSEGNDTRYELWLRALDLMTPLNTLVGNNFGLVTNSAPEKITKGIVESSLLQQILNIGLLATVIYYSILIRLKRIINKDYRIILYACLIQTLVYQSIEIIPFIIFLITLPLYSLSNE